MRAERARVDTARRIDPARTGNRAGAAALTKAFERASVLESSANRRPMCGVTVKALARMFLLVALWSITASQAVACRPYFNDFDVLLNAPEDAVVVGRFVPDPDQSPDHYSSHFLVLDVLKGDIRPGRRYRLVMTGPWGTRCESSTQDFAGSPAARDNPVLLIVERKVDDATLALPFMSPAAAIDRGNVISRKYHFRTAQGNTNLSKPVQIRVTLKALGKWLENDKAGPLDWQIDKP